MLPSSLLSIVDRYTLFELLSVTFCFPQDTVALFSAGSTATSLITSWFPSNLSFLHIPLFVEYSRSCPWSLRLSCHRKERPCVLHLMYGAPHFHLSRRLSNFRKPSSGLSSVLFLWVLWTSVSKNLHHNILKFYLSQSAFPVIPCDTCG